MGSNREGKHPCDHCWRRPKKDELDIHDNPQYYLVCRACGIIKQIPFDMVRFYDIYFPSFPDDEI